MPRKPAKSAPAVLLPAQAEPSSRKSADFGRETAATAVDSNAAFNASVEAIGQEVVGYAKASFENAGETVRALLVARTFEDVVRLQTDLAQRNFAALVERMAKLSELNYALMSASVSSWCKLSPP